jgi:acyl-CoA thioester hydrolase
MAEPADRPHVHRWPLRVYYEDTDAAGIVYHANYLRYAERARTEMLRALGFDHPRLRREHGVHFAVRRCAVDFLRPAVLDDTLAVETTVARAGGASLDLVQVILRGEAVVARVEVRLALLDNVGRPRRAPQPLREVLPVPGSRGAGDTLREREPEQ